MTDKARRILIIGRYMASFGGAHKYIRSLIKNLVAEGADVVLALNSCVENQAFRDDIRNLGAQLVVIQFDELSSDDIGNKLDKILIEQQPDVIDCEVAAKSVRRGILASRGFSTTNCLKIFTMHLAIKSEDSSTGIWENLYPFSSLNKTLREMRRFLNLFDAGISVSKFHADRIEELLKLQPNFFTYIPNGVQFEEFTPTTKTPNPELVIGGCGSLTHQKRFDLLIDAVAILRDRGLVVHARIAGEGDQREVLQKKVVDLELSQQVKLLGHVASTRAFYNEIDIFVMCSDHEGFPYAQIEAMASGLASVVTTTGDLPLIVKDGQEGYVVGTGDASALAEKIEILARDEKRRASFGRRAHLKVANDYKAHAQEQKTLQIFLR